MENENRTVELLAEMIKKQDQHSKLVIGALNKHTLLLEMIFLHLDIINEHRKPLQQKEKMGIVKT